MSVDSQELHLRLFLSSPGDVWEERLIVYEEVETFISNNPDLGGKVRLEPIGWDRKGVHLPMEANADPQSVIDKRLPKPSKCDIAVFVFWSRMGTELNPTKYVKLKQHQYEVESNDCRAKYYSGTEWEYFSAIHESQEDEDNLPHVFVFRKIPVDAVSLDDSEYEQKRMQFKRLERFLTWVNSEDKPYRTGSCVKYRAIEEFRDKIRETLSQIVGEIVKNPDLADRIRERRASMKGQAYPRWEGSPFPGLRSFRAEDAPIYFGRRKEIDQLVHKIRENRFVAVIGASGAGKSSLVYAGLLPALKKSSIMQPDDDGRDWDQQRELLIDSSHWIVVTMKPGESAEDGSINPFVTLYRSLAKVFPEAAHAGMINILVVQIQKLALEFIRLNTPENINSEQEKGKIGQAMADCKQGIKNFVEKLLEGKPKSSEIFLLVDQFEELFTLITDVQARKAFILFLQQFIECSRTRVLITMRADLYHYAVQYEELARMIGDGAFNLAPPGLGALNEMIRRPAAVAGLSFEEDLAEKILVETNTDENTGALPLMAYLLDQLYQRRTDTGSLTMTAYQELGGVAKAIAKSAEAVITELKSNFPEIDQTLYRVFKELVVLKDITTISRRRASKKAMFRRVKNAEMLINRLIDERLLVSDTRKDATTGKVEEVVEVAHEALLREWDVLNTWIRDNQDYFIERNKIERAAAEWVNHQEHSQYAWNHEQLHPFYKLMGQLDTQPEEFTPTEQLFMQPEALRLIAELALPKTTHKRRDLIGNRLAELGDPRFGIGLDPSGLPQIEWCPQPVPAKEVRLENVEEPFPVQTFYISRYPVTLGQFKAFVSAEDGYRERRWWDGMDVDPDTQRIYEQSPDIDNHPATRVSWFAAVAFCRWLSERVGYSVRLPFEWEWQHAASGGNEDQPYPWGREWNDEFCNSEASPVNNVVSVGLYPAGRASVGAEDLAGNVVEWCMNEFDRPDCSIDLKSTARRTTRGGAYFLTAAQRDAGKEAKDAVKVTGRIGDDPLAPAQGRIRVSFRLVADDLPAEILTHPALNPLRDVPEQISSYYVGRTMD